MEMRTHLEDEIYWMAKGSISAEVVTAHLKKHPSKAQTFLFELRQRVLNHAISAHGLKPMSEAVFADEPPQLGQPYVFTMTVEVDPTRRRPVSRGLEIGLPNGVALDDPRALRAALVALVRANPIPIPSSRITTTAATISMAYKAQGQSPTEDQLDAAARESALAELLMAWLVDFENVTVSSEDVDRACLSAGYPASSLPALRERLVRAGKMAALKKRLLDQNALRFVLAHAS